MCSGGSSSKAYFEQSRQANISKIKAKQKSDLSSVNVVTGGEAKSYRLSIATGAKKLGTTKETAALQDMSNLFSAKKGAAVQLKATRLKEAKDRKSMLGLFGSGGSGFDGSFGSDNTDSSHGGSAGGYGGSSAG